MVLVNVNGKDTVDASNLLMVLDAESFNPTAAKNDNRYISLTRTEKRNGNTIRLKTKTFLVNNDNIVFGIQLTPQTFVKKYYESCLQFGHETNGLIKVSNTDYYMLPNILYLTEELSKTQREEYLRLERLNRVFTLGRKTKSFMLVEGGKDRFMIKSPFARSTIITHIRELYRKER